MKRLALIFPVIVMSVILLLSPASPAASAPPKPDMIVFASSGTGSDPHVMCGTLSELMQRKDGIKTRVIPMDEKFARFGMLLSGQAHICTNGGTGLYGMQLGVLDFANAKRGGPQDFQMVYGMKTNFMPATTQKHKDINSITDLKGKRVTFMSEKVGWINQAFMLAFGGLGLDDVIKVNVGGMGGQPAAVLAGKADAVGFAAATLPPMEKLAASPKGLKWLQLPQSDTEAWKRLRAVAPMVSPGITTNAIGYEGKPMECASYFLGLTAYEKESPEIVYWVTKAIHENLDELKKTSGVWLSADRTEALNTKGFPHPYHAGAITYFKEIGKWTSDNEAWQQTLIKRQNDLKAAWQKTIAEARDGKWSAEKLEQEWDARQKAMTGFDTSWGH